MGSGLLRDGEVFLLVFFRALWLLCIPPVCGVAFRPSLIYFLLSLIKKKKKNCDYIGASLSLLCCRIQLRKDSKEG